MCTREANLNDNLKVLANILRQHFLQAFKGVLRRQCSEERQQEFWVQQVSVYNGSLDVEEIGIVLKGTLEKSSDELHMRIPTCVKSAPNLEETNLLAELCDVIAVVVGEHLVTHDRICNLRESQKIHLQQASLKGAMLRLVVLESIQQERCARLNQIALHEDVDNLVNIDQRRVLLGETLSKS